MSGVLIFIFSCVLYGESTPASIHNSKSLFGGSAILELTLQADFSTMCREREDENCDYTASTLSYKRLDNTMVVIPVEIKIRGGWRAQRRNCMVPPLFVRFSTEGTKATPFEGQSMLPLTTHCHDKPRVKGTKRVRSAHFEQNLLKEYLAYNIYTQLSDVSLRTRLVKIQYVGSASKSKYRYAFFTEHFQALAKRANMKLLPRKSFSEKSINLPAMDRVTLFNYMIGNLDWSIVRHRNIVLLGNDAGQQIPVPYDFDMSGIVNAMYATPPPLFPVDTVRDRYFLGFCHSDNNPLALAKQFAMVQRAILDQVINTPGLTEKTKMASVKYINSFYRIAKKSKKNKNIFTRQCRPWPPIKNDQYLEERKMSVEQW